MNEQTNRYEPRYVISVAAQMVSVHPQTLRLYERVGLVNPQRSSGNIRLYSDEDIERLRTIQRLVNDLGVNLAGAEIILNMREQLQELERQLDAMRRLVENELSPRLIEGDRLADGLGSVEKRKSRRGGVAKSLSQRERFGEGESRHAAMPIVGRKKAG
jgi:MerR family transcriptional regulator, heat shock protein HspR